MKQAIGRLPASAALMLAMITAAWSASVSSTPPVPITPHAVTAADYPVESLPAQEVGTTRVEYLVHADGTVRDTVISEPSGSPRLDQAAVTIVRRWLFKPATENGKPVQAWLYANVRFELRP